MAYIYNKILQRENTEFIIQQIKKNSRKSELVSFDRKTYHTMIVGELDNKTGKLSLVPELEKRFKPKTISDLKSRLSIC